MADIRFYHLSRSTLAQALPLLMEKSLGAAFRALVKAKDTDAAAELDGLLWTYTAGSFLPHGTASGGNAAAQPILITEQYDNLNEANLLAITDGSVPETFDGYDRVLDLFHEQDVEAARERWRSYKTAGHTMQYWQQTEAGGWEQKA